jgi:hypothetical protein
MTGRGAGAVAAATLFLLNIWICWRLLRFEYTRQFSSVEGFFIAMARYISTHWGGFSWWPLWHCGMPYQDTYVPLLHLVVAAVASMTKMPAARAYHVVTGIAYSLGAVMLFPMARRLGASRGAAFLAALFYSLFSPSALLQTAVAQDIGGWYNCRRLQVLTVYGEGPHVTSLALLPLVILTLQYAAEARTRRSLALAALAMATLFLTNVPGSMGTGLAVFCWIAVQPAGRWARAWAIAACAFALAYAIACYGAPPSSVATVLGNVGPMHSGFWFAMHTSPFLLPGALLVAAGLGFALRWSRLPLFARFGLLYFGLLAAIVLTAHAPRFELLPQAARLHLEMEIPACLLLGGLAWWLYAHSSRWLKPALAVLAMVAAAVQIGNYHAWTRLQIRKADLETRSEYTSARWLDTNLRGQRVYATGSDGFWLNAFTDLPQVQGCCEQGISMPVLRAAPYVIGLAVNPELTRLGVTYLEVLGAQALVASGPQSTDEYRGIQSPERYQAMLPVLHYERGDTIYGVPQRNASLAHVLRPGEAPAVRASQEAAVTDLVRYAAAIEDNSRPAADFQWSGPDKARIHATLRRDDLVSVQIGWFPGWKAVTNDHPRSISADGMGFILIRPECAGDCEITLTWTGPPDLKLCAWISGVAILLVVVLLASKGRPKTPLRAEGPLHE